MNEPTHGSRLCRQPSFPASPTGNEHGGKPVRFRAAESLENPVPGGAQTRSALPPQPIDALQVNRRRRPLARTLQAIAANRLTIGFIGGSITADWDHNWPTPVTTWLAGTFPNLSLTAENAAIGATGSDSACLRMDREIIQRHCDITFVEYAVNDHSTPSARRQNTREGLIRKLMAAGQDVVLVYTFCQEMYADMLAGEVPASIAEFEALAEYYGIGSVWAGLHALNEVRAGRLRWDEWLPDTLHPGCRGSWSYGQAVIAFLHEEFQVSVAGRTPPALPTPVSASNWETLREIPLASVEASGPWVLRRVHQDNHIEQILETNTPGAQLGFGFTGRGLVLIFDYGKKSAEFVYRLDDRAWQPVERERPAWCGDRGLARALVIAEDLPTGPHRFEMEVVHGNRPDCNGTECRLALIGVLTK